MKIFLKSWPVGKKLIVMTLPIIMTASVLAGYVEHSRNEAGLRDKLSAQAKSLASQIMIDRQYYASAVVPRITALGGTLGADYGAVHGRFPLPATFVREAAEASAQEHREYRVRLMSPWPINKTQGLTDEYQRAGLAFLESHPDDQFIQMGTVTDRPVLRVLLADRAVSASCVSCHNSHPDSPRRDFKVGDVIGGFEIDIPTDHYQHEIQQDLLLTLTGGGLMCLLVFGVMVVGTKTIVTAPLAGLAARMASFASPQSDGPQKTALSGNEVLALTQEFEAMASTIGSQQAALREANAHLEQRVLERTEQLRTTLAEKERISSELRVASSIQQSILPRTFPPFPARTEFDLYAESIPAKEMGGDFYDFFLIDTHHLGLVIADVSGKGVPAAIFMTVSRTLIKAEAMTGIGPDECLQRVNALLCEDNDAAMFVTVFYGVLDLRSGELVYANGGHNSPYLLSANGTATVLNGTGGIALGVIDDAVFQSRRLTLEAGTQLFLFTDGITEAMNSHEELFGDARLAASLAQASTQDPRELLGQVVMDVRRFVAAAPQSDDLTALALCYRGAS